MHDDAIRIFREDGGDDPARFVPGDYLHVRRGHVSMPVRVWWGPPRDLEHGGFMDRSPRWNIEIAGDSLIADERQPDFIPIARLEDVWPRCRDNPTVHSETAYRQARVEFARRHDDQDPFGHPQGRLNLLTATIPN